MKLLLCVATLATLTACTQATQAPVADTRDADIKAINALGDAALKAWTDKSMDGVMAQYADNAVLVVPGAPTASGKEAIRGMLAELMKDPALNLSFGISATEVDGSLAYQRGTYTMQMTDPKTKKPMTEKGATLMVFRKQAGGDWKVVEDFNTALPATP